MSSVTTTCRDISQLNKVAQTAVTLFFQECYKAGVHVFITETYRSQERQNYLYAQGRTRAGKVVTWTKNSRHTGRMAWDIGATTVNGNKDIYNTTIIKKAGAIAKKLGITWGGTWSTPDYPHFEVASSWKIPKGYSISGTVTIPIKSGQAIAYKGGTTSKPVSTSSTVTASTYKVKSGDTLSGIAVKYKTTVASLKSLNGLKSDLIKVGQVLVISK